MWLQADPDNPRWFRDDSGRSIVLTGFHTWNNLIDMRPGPEPSPFDFTSYLEKLSALDHNCIRLWAWGALCTWNPRDRVDTFPWKRTGPGEAIDGGPKFNLEALDDSYFNRLQERVRMAEERGIYVMVMLFDSWSSSDIVSTPNNWHLFSQPNNINGVDVARRVEKGWMTEWMALADPEVTRLQEAYVRRVVELLRDAPNVLYEVSNEAGRHSFRWQEHITDFVRQCESGAQPRHLIGICGGMDTRCDEFFGLKADWLAPEGWMPEGEEAPYCEGTKTWGDPPELARGPMILDTDHLWGIGGSAEWAWKSFLRGYHPLYMDPCEDFDARIFEHPWWPDARTNFQLRQALGAIQKAAGLVNLSLFRPMNHLASSGLCLAGPSGLIALVEPGGWADLSPNVSSFAWLNPLTGKLTSWLDSAGMDRVRNPEGEGFSILIGRTADG